jgi:transposase
MKEYIGCDAHRKFSVFVVADERGRRGKPVRCPSRRAEFRETLAELPAEADVGLEASGSWYWMVDEIERSGRRARLAHPSETKKRLPGKMKTDERDAGGIALLLRDGVLPEVWIPPSDLRDLRGLLRSRLGLKQHQTALKNRIHAALARYGLREDEEPNLFARRARPLLAGYIQALPPQTQAATRIEWRLVDTLEGRLRELEKRLAGKLRRDPTAELLRSLPGVGPILGATLALEIGDVERFASAERLSAYAGLVPLVRSSGGKTWLGETSKRSNHYLRWAYVEAANCVVAQKKRLAETHAVRLYEAKKAAKGHAKAAVALGHHLAEASWWMLRKGEPYRERGRPPAAEKVSSEIG